MGAGGVSSALDWNYAAAARTSIQQIRERPTRLRANALDSRVPRVITWRMLLLLACAVALINVPFGYLRAGVPRFSPAWFLYVHGSIPLVVALRLAAGIHWSLVVGGCLAAAFFAGQSAGHRLKRSRQG